MESKHPNIPKIDRSWSPETWKLWSQHDLKDPNENMVESSWGSPKKVVPKISQISRTSENPSLWKAQLLKWTPR